MKLNIKANTKKATTVFSEDVLESIEVSANATNWTAAAKDLTPDGTERLNMLHARDCVLAMFQMWKDTHKDVKTVERFDVAKQVVEAYVKGAYKAPKFKCQESVYGVYQESLRTGETKKFAQAIILFTQVNFGFTMGGKNAKYIARNIAANPNGGAKAYKTSSAFSDNKKNTVVLAICRNILYCFKNAGVKFQDVELKDILTNASLMDVGLPNELSAADREAMENAVRMAQMSLSLEAIGGMYENADDYYTNDVESSDEQ